MFENIGWGEILVLIVAGLFILGPERLPEAAAWLGSTIRKVRNFAAGARDQLRGELGSEFDELREPLNELRQPLQELRGLRNLSPKRAMVRSLLDDEPVFGPSNGYPNGYPAPSAPRSTLQPKSPAQPLTPGERPPFDPDAT